MSEKSLNTNSVKLSFVLIHAAWQGPYAWDLVKGHLLQAGFPVEVLQLPGHGTDTTDPNQSIWILTLSTFQTLSRLQEIK